MRADTSWPRAATVFVLAVALLLVTPGPPASAAIDVADEAAVAALVDRARALNGLSRLQHCTDLRDAARSWSGQMAGKQQLGHSPNLGQGMGGWRSLAEIVGTGSSPEAVHEKFLDSPPHRVRLLSSVYSEVGLGVDRRGDRVWVTVVFREPDGTVPCESVLLEDAVARACPPDRVPRGTFPDVAGNPHRAAVDCLVFYGVAAGTGDGQFSPASPLLRGQMATFLVRVVEHATGRLSPPRDQGFTDLGGGPHARAVDQLAGLGIVRGTSATAYQPNGSVTRGQMATLLVRTYEHLAAPLPPSSWDRFNDDNGHPHEDAINRAAAAGFLTGLAEGQYAPQRRLRRDQLASTLGRLLDRLVADGYTTPPAQPVSRP